MFLISCSAHHYAAWPVLPVPGKRLPPLPKPRLLPLTLSVSSSPSTHRLCSISNTSTAILLSPFLPALPIYLLHPFLFLPASLARRSSSLQPTWFSALRLLAGVAFLSCALSPIRLSVSAAPQGSMSCLPQFQSDAISQSMLDRKIARYFFAWGVINVFLGGMLGGLTQVLSLLTHPGEVTNSPRRPIAPFACEPPGSVTIIIPL